MDTPTSRKAKSSLLLNLSSSLAGSIELSRKAPYGLGVSYHSTPVIFHVETREMKAKLVDLFPKTWLDTAPNGAFRIHVTWLNPETQCPDLAANWDQDLIPACDVEQFGEKELVVQRDFAAVGERKGSEIHVVLLAPYETGDGFFNSMRWLLPRFMVSRDAALLHSSCVIGFDGKARIFLGPSGAGKTTVTRLRGDRAVLGDDMNVFGFGEIGAYAELGLFGQSVDSTFPAGRQVPVAGLYFLKQNSTNGLRKMAVIESARRFSASCANLFWQHLGEQMAPAVFELAMQVAQTVPCYELEFNLNGDFWTYVEGQTQTL